MNNDIKTEELPILDFEDMLNWIVSKTEYEKEIIMNVLDAETEYMEKLGLIEVGIPFDN